MIFTKQRLSVALADSARPMRKHLYTYCGFLGSGKGFISGQDIAKLKYDGHSVFLTAWADPLKEMMACKLGILKSGITSDYAVVTKDELKQKLLYGLLNVAAGRAPDEPLLPKYVGDHLFRFEAAWEKYGDKVFKAYSTIDLLNHQPNQRTLIQTIGTELGRAVKQDMWIAATLTKVEKAFEFCNHVIVDDARFINEYEALADFANRRDISFKAYGIYASRATRARRRKMTVEAVKETEKHQSEYETAEILKRIPKSMLIDNDQDV